jgi:geranylgeranyl pyrophosphate synthase
MKFMETLNRYQKMVDKEVENLFSERIKRIEEPIIKENYAALRDYVLRGGKRLRPVAFIMAYKGTGGQDEKRIIGPSISVELFHNSTLTHDDIMDEDSIRRGGPTHHELLKSHFLERYSSADVGEAQRFGSCMAILGGNILSGLGMHTLLTADFPEEEINRVMGIYKDTYLIVNHGQYEDIDFEYRKNLTEDDYLRMVDRKTSYLFSAGIQMGATFGNATDKQLEALKRYARPMAQGFQIQDDILGSFGVSEDTGKPSDSDIMEGKKTLLSIKAFELANKSQREQLNTLLGSAQVTEVRDLFKSTGALDYCKKRSKELASEAKKYLKEADLTDEANGFFTGFADFVINRDY